MTFGINCNVPRTVHQLMMYVCVLQRASVTDTAGSVSMMKTWQQNDSVSTYSAKRRVEESVRNVR